MQDAIVALGRGSKRTLERVVPGFDRFESTLEDPLGVRQEDLDLELTEDDMPGM